MRTADEAYLQTHPKASLGSLAYQHFEEGYAAAVASVHREPSQARAIKLHWDGPNEFSELIATVPAQNYAGTGFYVIHAIRRPHYCDRGKWHVLVEPQGVAGLDDQEGFPRYYFRLENLQDEMEIWVNERQDCRQAAGLGEKG